MIGSSPLSAVLASAATYFVSGLAVCLVGLCGMKGGGEGARAGGGRTAANLAAYEGFLRARNVLTDLEAFSRTPLFLKSERLFDVYPRLVIDLAERVYRVDGTARDRLVDAVLKEANASGVSKLTLMMDLLKGARSM